MRADAAQNRARIMAAARELFIEQGPDVPADHIMERSGVSSGTFYRRFPDRTSLLRAIVLDESDATLSQLHQGRQVIENSGEWIVWRDAVIHLVANHGRFFPHLTVALSGQLAEDTEASAAYESVYQEICATITTAQKCGFVRDDITPNTVVTYLLILIRPLPNLPRAHHSRVRDGLVEAVLKGLRPDCD